MHPVVALSVLCAILSAPVYAQTGAHATKVVAYDTNNQAGGGIFNPNNALGVKGGSETGTIGPPAAIANAINDALAPLGVEVTELPITPRRLLAAIAAAGNG